MRWREGQRRRRRRGDVLAEASKAEAGLEAELFSLMQIWPKGGGRR